MHSAGLESRRCLELDVNRTGLLIADRRTSWDTTEINEKPVCGDFAYVERIAPRVPG